MKEQAGVIGPESIEGLFSDNYGHYVLDGVFMSCKISYLTGLAQIAAVMFEGGGDTDTVYNSIYRNGAKVKTIQGGTICTALMWGGVWVRAKR